MGITAQKMKFEQHVRTIGHTLSTRTSVDREEYESSMF
jgi:hypothetical protein